ncbi:uncharacterized protein DMENIID0001_087510 [Sergentomyia squamirostris]
MASNSIEDSCLTSCLSSVSGAIITQRFKKFKTLNENDRCQLSTLVIHNEFDKFGRDITEFTIKTERFLQLRDEICARFPGEKPEEYFTPFNQSTRSTSTGKLFNSFNTLKRKWKESLESDSNVDSDEDSDDIQELRSLQSLDVQAFQLWRKTHSYRQKLLSNSKYTVSMYYNQFPLLKVANGYQFLLLDFDMMHENQTKKFLENWPAVNEKLINLALKKLKRKKVRELSMTCSNEIFGFFLLTSLLPMAFKILPNCDVPKRLCREEIQEELFFHVKDNESLQNVIECDNERRNEARFPINPRIVFVGRDFATISKAYVEIDMNMYEMKNPLSAIDTYLKVYMALNISYPNEVKQIWTFIQNYVYQIKTAEDLISVSINGLIADLEANERPPSDSDSDSDAFERPDDC